ncbi:MULTISPECIES: carbohydrate kinase family protein [Citrobacter]|uniref:Carbohydrate kinase n=1 Tax=Citrobacter braakii TaxID=57706 RepID=A0A8I0G951_CITBR|nr:MULTISPECIES: carbohydrate kinase [Citrobacter]MBD3125603.1 carbohydrate kinase [Citrobacter braakii]MDM3386905.1 carbohydrate kinase [Citrobacter sp. Cb011]MDM3419557.1 carbohydrate kinase [Citrobacter sp. Cb025]MDM3439983.1 carbohydrate kinase [Citrobacter sp. Cb063]MEB7705732.1 carbohydrate kinase [Citrobacter braakii]
MRGHNIACIGELLIDFVCTDIGLGLEFGASFLKKAGGAPANVAVAINRSGGQARLAAKVGYDPFGDFLLHTLKSEGIDCSGVSRSSTTTTLAFVGLQNDGERDFTFCRGADGELGWQDIPSDFLDDVGIVHFGAAIGLLDGELYATYQRLLHEAKRRGLLVSFDPNYRGGLWGQNPQEFIVRCTPWFQQADIVKVSEEELHFITGAKTDTEGCQILHEAGVSYVTVTCGRRGTWVSHRSGMQQLIPSVPVDAVDSTGAGDAFIGALLAQIARSGSRLDDGPQFLHAVRWANICGALTCMKFGAIDAIPVRQDVDKYLNE